MVLLTPWTQQLELCQVLIPHRLGWCWDSSELAQVSTGLRGGCFITGRVRGAEEKGCFPCEYIAKDLDPDGVGKWCLSWSLTRVGVLAQRGPVRELERDEQGREVALLRL